MKEYDDFTLIAEAFAQALVEQNIRYAEVHYVPGEHCKKGWSISRFPKDLNESKITEAIRKGLECVKNVDISLILDICRDLDPVASEDTLSQAKELKEFGVIGIGLGGSEQKFPPELFKQVFQQARNFGFHTTAHAGEAAGPESIWRALMDLEVKRIGHGTRAIEDLELIDYLGKNRIVLEMCPLSNYKTKVVEDLSVHPIRRFFDCGLVVTVNTDDPAMFNNSLAGEYRSLSEVHNFSQKEICQLIENAINGSWLNSDKKSLLVSEFRSAPEWIP